MKAKFVQRGESIDYTSATDVAAGDIVVQGDLVGVAKLDIPAGKLGSLSVCGVYDIVKKASETITVGAQVYWDANAATATTGEVVLGVAVAAAAGTDATVRVLLNAVPCAIEG
jgi:predicted RecA/RadA family phage recombinase